MKFFLLNYTIIYSITLFVIPSYLTYKRTGTNPFLFKKEDNVISLLGKLYKSITILMLVFIIVNTFFPVLITNFGPIKYFETSNIKLAGYIIICLSFIWIFIAQRNMANEWRMGIDNDAKVKLVTKGLFRVGRNPIFLGVIFTFAGVFLIIPNTISAVLLCSIFIVVQIQVRLEEEFLTSQLGDEYKTYLKNTKRWLL